MARRLSTHVLRVLILVAFPFALTPSTSLLAQKGVAASPAATQQILMGIEPVAEPNSPVTLGDAVDSSPVMFVENAGQWDGSARFQVYGGPAGAVWLTEDAIWLSILEPAQLDDAHSPLDSPSGDPQPVDQPHQGAAVKLSFVGANPHPVLEPFDPLDIIVSYFLGNDPAQWRAGVPVWGGIRYVDLYPGVDLELTGEGAELVQRLSTRPGADLDSVRLRVEGVDAAAVDGDVLRLGTPAGDVAWQLLQAEGSSGEARVQPRGVQAFDLVAPFATAYLNRPSPVASVASPADNSAHLLYSTFLGGSDYDEGWGIAVDGVGGAYVTGQTYSTGFPTTPGAFDTSHNGSYDAFVVKLNAVGSALDYASFLGGTSMDYGYGVAVDSLGSAYVIGSTGSTGFPTTPRAFDTSHNGSYDAFVVKLNAAGSALDYASFLGGTSSDSGNDIAVDGVGSTYVIGSTGSIDFPTTPGAFDTSHNGGSDLFVTKLNEAGSSLTFSTLLGESAAEYACAVAVDDADSAYVLGYTYSDDFPTTPGAYDTTQDSSDNFVVKLNQTGGDLVYSTFLGGGGYDWGKAGLDVDSAGSAYIAGWTTSSSFPTTLGAFDTTCDGYDAFVVKLNASGTGVDYSTCLGGRGADHAHSIALDGAGNAWVTGHTDRDDFPVTLETFDSSYNGQTDFFVARLNGTGTALDFSTYLGGQDFDDGLGIAVDTNGAAYVTGYSWSQDFPTTPWAFDQFHSSDDYDTLASKLAIEALVSYPVSGHVRDAVGTPIAGVTVWAGASSSGVTDVSGAYIITGLITGTYTLTPSKVGYTFTPASRTVTVPPEATGQDFIGTLTALSYSVTGLVTDNSDIPFEDVLVAATGGYWAITDASGAYTVSDLPAGTYTLTPSKPGYTFDPASRTVTVPPSATEQDFVGILESEKRPVILLPGMMSSINWDPLCFFLGTSCGTIQDWDWTPLPTGGTAQVYYDLLMSDLEAAGYTSENHLLTVVLYDWRRPIAENVTWLKQAIDEAKGQTGADEVDLIGHSMGGLLGRAYVQDASYANDVAHLITLGSPHYGSAKAYPFWEAAYLYRMLPTERFVCSIISHYLALSRGPIESFLFLKELRAWAPSTLQVMPTSGYMDTGQTQSGYLYDEDQGDQLKPESMMQHRNTYLAALNADLPTLFARTEVTTLFGHDVGTPVRFYVTGGWWLWPNWDDGKPNWDRENPGFMAIDGDGTVWASSAVLPPPAGQVPVSGPDHSGLPGNQDVIDAVFATLGIPQPAESLRPSRIEEGNGGYLVLAVYGPADATVEDPTGQMIGPEATTIPGARYITDPTGSYKLILITSPAEGSFEIDVQGQESGPYVLALLDTFNPVPDLVDDPLALWDSSQAQIEPAVTVGYAFTYTQATSPTTSLVAVTPVIDVPVWVGSTAVNGRARPGHAVEIRDADVGVVLGSGTIGSDGHFAVLLAAPLPFNQRIVPWSEGLTGVPVRVQAHMVYLPLVMSSD